MSIRGATAIVGVGETAVDRSGTRPGEGHQTTSQYLSAAMRLALEDAGLTKNQIDGQGFGAIISTTHAQPFWAEEAAEILGVSPGLLLTGGQGGASSVSLLGQAAAAINAGLVELVLIVAAAAPFVELSEDIQPTEARDFEMPYGYMGPNSKIALVMRRHMHEYGSTLDDFGKIALTARYHASLNPAAYLQQPMTLEEYKASRLIADPIRLFDCVLPANGGKAYIVASAERARPMVKHPVYLLGFGERDNPSYGSRAASDILKTGVADAGLTAMMMAGVEPADVDLLNLYDDYVCVVYLQIEDLGFCAKGDLIFFRQTDFKITGNLPIQTGGGMINCGQPSTVGGMLHIIETVHQLRGEAGKRQVSGATIGLASGLGSLPYGKNFGCAAVAVLGNEAAL